MLALSPRLGQDIGGILLDCTVGATWGTNEFGGGACWFGRYWKWKRTSPKQDCVTYQMNTRRGEFKVESSCSGD